MKKEGEPVLVLSIILAVIVVILAVGLVFLWNSHSELEKAFEEEKDRERRVYFTEEQTVMFKKDPGEFCTQLCEERRHDGLAEGVIAKEGLSFVVYECKCYRIVS